MENLIKKIFFVFTITNLFTSCVNENFTDPIESICVDPELTKTKEVAELYKEAKNPILIPPSIILNTPTYTKDDVIEAYVISSDEGGNFYKSMYFQPLDGSRGFNLSIDEGNTYTKNFPPGKKVFLKLRGLAYANPSDLGRGLVFGAPPTEKYDVDRLSNLTYKNFLIPSCDAINEDEIVHKIDLNKAINAAYLNTLVEIDDVQFKIDCSEYSKTDYDTSLKITNDIRTLDVRTSRFANFAGLIIPSGRGKIRGVLTRYNSTYQIILRTERDVNMNLPRIQTASLPKTGNKIQYLGAFSENFESYASSINTSFPKYINDAQIGTKYWDVVLYSSNKYLQISAFNNGCTKAYFIVPVDLSAASGFTFKTKDGYNDGDPLKVYYSTDYVPGKNISQYTLVDITNKFVISSGNAKGYGSTFINSGTYLIPPSVTGNGYFIFEYDATNGITTTIQIDDINVN
jgi:hypothetical protein